VKPANAIRLVPKDPDPYEETEALVERLGWVPSEDYGEDIVEWNVPGSDALVNWVVDGDTGATFFVVEGADRERVAKQIADSIDMLGVDDFADYLAEPYGRQERMRRLYSVAAAAPEHCDRRVLELFDRYMRHEDPFIRCAAVYAAAMIGWPELAEPVSRLREDADPDVRQAVEEALEVLAEPD